MCSIVTIVRTAVTPSVMRAGGLSRGRRKATQDITTMMKHGPYTSYMKLLNVLLRVSIIDMPVQFPVCRLFIFMIVISLTKFLL